MKSSVAGFVLLLTALFFSACATETGIGGSDIPQLSPSEMMEDLAFIHDKVTAVHPAFLDGQPAGFQEALGLVQAEASVPLTRIAFISALNGMLRLIDDAHTAVRFPDELLAPRLPLVWLASGLFAHQDITTGSEVPQIESGDQIIAIAGYPMDAVSHIVADTLIVTESRDDLRAAGLPLIFSEALLSNLGVPPSQPAVLVSVLRDGVAQEVSYVRYEANGRRAAYFAEAAVYSIPGYDDWSFPRIAGAVLAPQIRALSRDGIVYVRFDRCHLDDQYQEGLRRMAASVKQHDATAVVLDLRYNVGGDSRVVQEFLRYFGVRQYAGFSRTTRFSIDAARQRGYSQTSGIEVADAPIVELQPLGLAELILDVDLYVLISNHTDSSANWFATIVKENGLGTVVGEPTGNPPDHFGDVIFFTTPAIGLELTVSHKHFVPPSKAPSEFVRTLTPDMTVETTIEDVLNGYDRQMAYVIAHYHRRMPPARISRNH